MSLFLSVCMWGEGQWGVWSLPPLLSVLGMHLTPWRGDVGGGVGPVGQELVEGDGAA